MSVASVMHHKHDPLSVGKLLMIDTLDMSFRTLKVQRNPECPVCGIHPTVTELIDYDQFCGLPSHNDGTQATELGVQAQEVLAV